MDKKDDTFRTKSWNGTSWIDLPLWNLPVGLMAWWLGGTEHQWPSPMHLLWHEELKLMGDDQMCRLIDEGSFVHIEVDMMLGGRLFCWKTAVVCLKKIATLWPRVKNVKMVRDQNHSININKSNKKYIYIYIFQQPYLATTGQSHFE